MPRVVVNGPVEIQPEGTPTPLSSMAIDLSVSGIGVSSAGFADVGDIVQCGLLFTPKKPLWLAARVVRHSESSGSTGMIFEDVTANRGAELRALVERMAGTGIASLSTPVGIDPFCESGTWSREIVLENSVITAAEDLAIRPAEPAIRTTPTERIAKPKTYSGAQLLWVAAAALTFGISLTAAALWLLR